MKLTKTYSDRPVLPWISEGTMNVIACLLAAGLMTGMLGWVAIFLTVAC